MIPWVCCVALPCLFVCLTLLASFFLPSHLSLKYVYISEGQIIVHSHTRLLGWLVFVVLLSPEFGIHLQLHVLEVHLPPCLLHVPLGNVVGGVSPVGMLGELGQLLPAETRVAVESGSGHS